MPFHKFMKVGIVHFMAYPETINSKGPILKTLEKIAVDPYFDLVEITWIKEKETRRKVRELLDSANIEVKYGAQPRLLLQGLDINSLQEEKRKKAVQSVKEGIDEAFELNATSLALLSGKDPGKGKRQPAIEMLVKSIRELCDYAHDREKGFPIVLEIFDREIDKKCLIGPSKDARQLAEKVDRPNFGLMHDLSHLPLLKESPSEALEPIKNNLVHVHIGNCIIDKSHPIYGDTHPCFGINGGANNVKDVKEFLQTLKRIGYFQKPKPVSFEVKPLENESSEVVIANAKRVLNKAWSLAK